MLNRAQLLRISKQSVADLIAGTTADDIAAADTPADHHLNDGDMDRLKDRLVVRVQPQGRHANGIKLHAGFVSLPFVWQYLPGAKENRPPPAWAERTIVRTGPKVEGTKDFRITNFVYNTEFHLLPRLQIKELKNWKPSTPCVSTLTRKRVTKAALTSTLRWRS